MPKPQRREKRAMAKYFLHVKVFSRGKGSRVTRAAAYRAGERIHDDRTSESYDYSDRQDIPHKEILLPSQLAGRTDVNWARERSALWNAVEQAGQRRNARLAREVLVTLPPELAQAERTELARRCSRELADRYGRAVDLAVHEPRAGSDERHHHAHLLMTAREVRPGGLGPRTIRELSGTARHARGLGPTRDELLWIRERWAQLTNEALREAGLEERVDHRSYRDQGIDREPTPLMPRNIYYAERNSGRPHPAAEDIRARHRERIEARSRGPRALARVLEAQKKEGRRRAMEDAARKRGLPKRIPHGALNREELNRARRERYPKIAAELNRKRRERRRANAAEINRTRREWSRAHREEVNRRQREAYRRRRAAQGAVRRGRQSAAAEPPRGPAGAKQKSPTAAAAANRRPDSREHRQRSPTAEESARRWQEFRERAGRSPTAEESARRWVEWRERQGSAAAPANTEDVEAAPRDRRRDNTHGL